MHLHLIKMGLGDRVVTACIFQKKIKHNRIFQDFQGQLVTPLHCRVWETCILSPEVLSKILASVVNIVLSPVEGSLSNPRGSQCDLVDNTVAWNYTDLPPIPAPLLVG